MPVMIPFPEEIRIGDRFRRELHSTLLSRHSLQSCAMVIEVVGINLKRIRENFGGTSRDRDYYLLVCNVLQKSCGTRLHEHLPADFPPDMYLRCSNERAITEADFGWVEPHFYTYLPWIELQFDQWEKPTNGRELHFNEPKPKQHSVSTIDTDPLSLIQIEED